MTELPLRNNQCLLDSPGRDLASSRVRLYKSFLGTYYVLGTVLDAGKFRREQDKDSAFTELGETNRYTKQQCCLWRK